MTHQLPAGVTIIIAVGLLGPLASGPASGPAPGGRQDAPPTGYDDTPKLPDSPWRVHDGARPRPPVVSPGEPSGSDRPAEPPSDAVVLFDGADLSRWRRADGGPARWKVEQGFMEVVAKTGDIETREAFGDCQLHVEWSAPALVRSGSQGRGNSGVFLMGRYEVQVLDSFENPTYADGQASAIYGQFPPLVNASRRPGEWQTYDIVFTAPRFQDGRLVSPAFLTVFHNGVLVHHHRALIGATAHRVVGTYSAHAAAPLRLQDHGDPVRFRAIWIRRLNGAGN